MAVDVGVIVLCALLLRAETRAGERRLERMTRGARLGNLRLEDAVTRQVVPLKELRGRKRIVLVTGSADQVATALPQDEETRDELERSSLVVVPLPTADAGERAREGGRWVPYAREEWRKWLDGEREEARKKLKRRMDEVFVIVVRLDGKVGARSVGAPKWGRLLQEVAKLPPKDNFGKP